MPRGNEQQHDPAGQQGIVNVRLNVQPYSGCFYCGLKFNCGLKPGCALDWNFSSIDDSFSKFNMSSFIDISQDDSVWFGRSGVAKNWKANIAATVKAASSRLATGAVAGLFLGAPPLRLRALLPHVGARACSHSAEPCAGDEIVCGGVSEENMTAVAAWGKQQLVAAGHGGLVYVNECKPSFTKVGMIPAGLDIISFDQYELANESKFAPTPWWLQEPKGNQAFAAQFIAPEMHPHQRLIVVPGFYGNDTATKAEHAVQDGRLLAKLEAYWTWIKADENIVGLNPYHWVRFKSVFRQRPTASLLLTRILCPNNRRRSTTRTRAPSRQPNARACATDRSAGPTANCSVGARRTIRDWWCA